jgi:DNA modification methylase
MRVNGVEVVHADSLTWILDKDPRDWAVLFIDPPYGAKYASSWPGVWRDKGIRGDSDTAARDAAMTWWGEGAAAVWTKWNYGWFGKPRGMLVWDKGMGTGMGDLSFPWKPNWEMCGIYGQGWSGHRGSSVIQSVVPNWSAGVSSAHNVNRSHPHEKPLGMCMAILEKAPPGEVLDLFGGGGTVAVACARLGRPCTVVEIDEQWIPTIHRRVATEGAQRPLFA